jgi:hypothetical protein
MWMQNYGLVAGILVLLVVVLFPYNKPEVEKLPKAVQKIIASSPDESSSLLTEKAKRDVEVAVNQFGVKSAAGADALYQLAQKADFQKHWGDAEALYLLIIEIMENTPPTNFLSLESSIYGLVRLYMKQDKFKEALPLMERMLLLEEKKHGPRHRFLGDTIVSISRACINMGDFDKAEKFLRRIETLEKGPSPEGEYFRFQSLHYQGFIKDLTGDFNGADKKYLEATQMSKEMRKGKIRIVRSPGVHYGGGSLAENYILSIYEDSVANREKIFGNSSSKLLPVLGSLKEFYEARDWYDNLDEISKRINQLSGGQEPLHLISSLSGGDQALPLTRPDSEANDGVHIVYPSQGSGQSRALSPQYNQVGNVQYNQTASFHYQSANGQYPVNVQYNQTANGQYQVGNVQCNQTANGQYPVPSVQGHTVVNSQSLLVQPETVTSQNQLDQWASIKRLNDEALSLKQQGKMDRAVSLFEERLRLLEEEHGFENILLTECLSRFGAFCELNGDFDTAEKLYKRTLSIREKSLGKDSEKVGWSLQSLGDLYYQKSRLKKGWLGDTQKWLKLAAYNYNRQLEISEKLYGEQEPQLSLILRDLSMVYGDMNKSEIARELRERAACLEQKKEWKKK